MCQFEGFGDFFQLAVAFGAAPIYRRAYGYGARVPGAFYGAEHGLIIAIGQAEEFVVVELYDERDAVAYLRLMMLSTPKVEATALQPASMASLMIFSGSKYMGFAAKEAPPAMLDALVDREDET